MTRNLRIKEVAYHRNGITGEGFHVVRFCEGAESDMVAIVFEGSGQVAVLDIELLHQGVIAFGQNSWRGDVYEPYLRPAIADFIQLGRDFCSAAG